MTPITVTAAQAAELTGLAVATIYALVRSGQLPAAHYGRKVLIEHDALVRFVKALPAEGPTS